MIKNLDNVSEDLAEGGLRLHPDSAKTLAPRNRAAAWHIGALWAAVAALLLALLLG